MMCSITRRTDQLAPAEPRRLRERMDGVEIGQRGHQFVGPRGDLLVALQGLRPAFRLFDNWFPSLVDRYSRRIASAPPTANHIHLSSAPATCLIRPPRVNWLTVVRCSCLLLREAGHGVPQKPAVLRERLQQVGPLAGEGGRAGHGIAFRRPRWGGARRYGPGGDGSGRIGIRR